jgi:hypothetical protein
MSRGMERRWNASLRSTKGWGNGNGGATRLNRSWMKQQKSNGHREVSRLAEWEKLWRPKILWADAT